MTRDGVAWRMAYDQVLLQAGVPEFLEETIAGILAYLPRVLGALVILLIGYAIGRLLGGGVRRLTDRTELDKVVMKTPIGDALGGTEASISRSFGLITAYFVYAIAVLAAADALAITLLSQWIADAVSYLPAFVAGALIIVLGFVLADFLADVVGRTETLTDVRYTEVFADGMRVFLYFVAVVVGLDTMGVDVQILYLLTAALAGGLGLGLALAIGIAFGFGGRDYVAANIGDWLPGERPGRGGEPPAMGQTDGGGDESVD